MGPYSLAKSLQRRCAPWFAEWWATHEGRLNLIKASTDLRNAQHRRYQLVAEIVLVIGVSTVLIREADWFIRAASSACGLVALLFLYFALTKKNQHERRQESELAVFAKWLEGFSNLFLDRYDAPELIWTQSTSDELERLLYPRLIKAAKKYGMSSPSFKIMYELYSRFGFSRSVSLTEIEKETARLN